MPFYWLLEFYILDTWKVISGHVPTCDALLYCVSSLRNQAASTMNWYLISHSVTLSVHVVLALIKPCAWPLTGNLSCICHWYDLNRVRTRGFESHDLPKRETDNYQYLSWIFQFKSSQFYVCVWFFNVILLTLNVFSTPWVYILTNCISI